MLVWTDRSRTRWYSEMWSLIDPFRKTLPSLLPPTQVKNLGLPRDMIAGAGKDSVYWNGFFKSAISTSVKWPHWWWVISGITPSIAVLCWPLWCISHHEIQSAPMLLLNGTKRDVGVFLLEQTELKQSHKSLNYRCVHSQLKMNTWPWSQLPQRLSDSFPLLTRFSVWTWRAYRRLRNSGPACCHH